MTTTTLLKSVTITKALKAAGFQQSRDLTSGIRGWGNSTEGFTAETEKTTKYFNEYHYTPSGKKVWKQTSTPTGRVFVNYQQSTNINITWDSEKQEQMMNEMQVVLEGLGYTVTREPYITREQLVVTR